MHCLDSELLTFVRRLFSQLHFLVVFLVHVFVAEVGGFDIAFNATTVEALTFEFISQYTTRFGLFEQRVSDLNFTAFARLGLLNQIKNIWREDITRGCLALCPALVFRPCYRRGTDRL